MPSTHSLARFDTFATDQRELTTGVEWDAGIYAAQEVLEEAIKQLRAIAMRHGAPDAEWERAVGHLKDAYGDLPELYDEYEDE